MRYFSYISWDFLHYFQIFLIFLYVCQSVRWLTSLLKLGQYRGISSSGWYMFQNFLETFLGFFCTISKIFCISCMSVSLSLSLLYPGGQLLRPLVLFNISRANFSCSDIISVWQCEGHRSCLFILQSLSPHQSYVWAINARINIQLSMPWINVVP